MIRSKLNNRMGLLLLGFIAGLIIMYIFIQPFLFYQGKSAQVWANLAINSQKLADQNQQRLTDWEQMYSTLSAELETLQNKPTPTPVIKIVNKAQSCQSIYSISGQYMGESCGGNLVGPNGHEY